MMFRKTPGQMTIEFVVAFPAMIAVAFVAINAVLFFSDCASFDRVCGMHLCRFSSLRAGNRRELRADSKPTGRVAFSR